MGFSLVLSIVSMALIALAAPAAFAQTPDGETPAVETICDPLLHNASPGLFGLCVAYCEAKDCNSNPVAVAQCQAENPGDPWGVHSCGCGRLLDNYNRKRQAGDPEMPCIQESCPCFDAEFLANELSAVTVCIDTSVPRREQTLVNGSDSDGCRAIAQTFRTFGNAGNSIAVVCQAVDNDIDPANGQCVNTLSTLQSGLSGVEFEACQDLILAHCSP